MKKRTALTVFLLSSFVMAQECVDATQPKIAQLKKQILKVATENMMSTETRKQVREQLDPLVQELAVTAGPVTEKAWMDYAPGSWQQIWSDERDNSPAGAPQQDYGKIYQYISVQGWGFNFGERVVAPGQSVTFALSVVGSVKGNEQTTEITKAFARPGPLERGESLAELSHKIKTGASSGFLEVPAGRFPQGPIGAKGILKLQFIDADLKVGYAANVYTGEMELFVLSRTDIIVR